MNKSNQKNKSSNSSFLRLSSASIQMAAVIAAFTYLGSYLDHQWLFATPWMTMILGLIGVGIGMYLIIKAVNQLNQKNEE